MQTPWWLLRSPQPPSFSISPCFGKTASRDSGRYLWQLLSPLTDWLNSLLEDCGVFWGKGDRAKLQGLSAETTSLRRQSDSNS